MNSVCHQLVLPSFRCNEHRHTSGRVRLVPLARRRPPPGSGSDGDRNRQRANSRKGNSYENKKRRRGRPAWQRSPDDTPYRDGNRDRLIGLVTKRAAKTLCYYLSETNLHLYQWLNGYMYHNPIPETGAWDDVSGETFLRGLLGQPVQSARYDVGRDAVYDSLSRAADFGVDPRSIAQRIMEIRSQVAKEMIEDLKAISEENALLLRESLTFSFSLDNIVAHPADSPIVEPKEEQ